MVAQGAQTCQKCQSTITAEQIAAKQAGTVRGIWLCPPCVEVVKQQVAMSHSGLLDGPKTPVPAATAPQPAVSIPAAETSNYSLNPVSDSGSLGPANQPESASPRVEGGSAIRTLASRGGAHGEYSHKRPIAAPELGSTRCRTFHARMSTAALQNMDHQINEWLDTHPEIHIKTAVSTVGVFEAKISSEEHLVVTLFY